jgi:hypothetical protein
MWVSAHDPVVLRKDILEEPSSSHLPIECSSLILLSSQLLLFAEFYPLCPIRRLEATKPRSVVQEARLSGQLVYSVLIGLLL